MTEFLNQVCEAQRYLPRSTTGGWMPQFLMYDAVEGDKTVTLKEIPPRPKTDEEAWEYCAKMMWVKATLSAKRLRRDGDRVVWDQWWTVSTIRQARRFYGFGGGFAFLDGNRCVGRGRTFLRAVQSMHDVLESGRVNTIAPPYEDGKEYGY
jgi:hypothetical protein